MSKKGKKTSVPRPKRRGTAHKGELSQSNFAWLAVLLGRVKLFLRRNWALVKGVLIFAGCIVAFMLIRTWLLDDEALAGFFVFTAGATGFVLNLFGAWVQMDGTLIHSPDFAMRIVSECTGIIPMAIYLSAVIAYPCAIKQKAIGAALGIAAIAVLNLVRTVSLFFIGSHLSSGFFDTAHMLIWQPVMILAAIVIWLLWVEKLVHVTPH